ncbi:hypothetical protein L211DRAFT_899738 [Terfezia boudieri ATCC MYA-4762]|uniref:Uncharacterized protein n=1 Tax=Terfezia boudieri ATCC MYA-4762 TaxID=1051890 RepID=A0A3N4LZ99_9PEZI|nr:hypothetical protein L211DRAFT_899738 [Terfezia boudieri ATCC MYA-4762]
MYLLHCPYIVAAIFMEILSEFQAFPVMASAVPYCQLELTTVIYQKGRGHSQHLVASPGIADQTVDHGGHETNSHSKLHAISTSAASHQTMYIVRFHILAFGHVLFISPHLFMAERTLILLRKYTSQAPGAAVGYLSSQSFSQSAGLRQYSDQEADKLLESATPASTEGCVDLIISKHDNVLQWLLLSQLHLDLRE